MNRVIVFADARSRISLKEKATLARHTEYILRLRNLEGFESTQLLVLQPSLSLFKSEVKNLEYIKIVRLSFIGLLKLKVFFERNHHQVALIVSGDPWESYAFSVVIKRLLKEDIPVQVQVHAELSTAWSALRVSYRFRTYVAGIALRKALSIRTVSLEQRDFLVKRYKVDRTKMVVVPVQININGEIDANNLGIRPLTIGFIGRLHRERNIKRFVEIAEYFISLNSELRIVIATTGRMDSKEGKLFSLISKERLTKFENLSPDRLQDFWEKVGVLISTSQSESFGRSIREAIVNGIPVMAQTSMGSRELKRECSDSVELFDKNDSAESLFETFKELRAKNIPSEYKKDLKNKNKRIPLQIAESWKRTADMRPIG